MLIWSIEKYHHQTIGYLWGKEALILCPCLQRIPLFVCNFQIEPNVTEIKSTAVLPYIKDYQRVISVRSHASLGCCFKFVWVRHWRKCIELWKWDRTRQKGRKLTLTSRKKETQINFIVITCGMFSVTDMSISSRTAKGLILVRVFFIRELTVSLELSDRSDHMQTTALFRDHTCPLNTNGYDSSNWWSIGANGTIGTNRKAPYSNGSVGAYASN